MDDFLAHIDRWTVKIERDLHDIDGPHNARAKASWLKQENLLSGAVAGRKRSEGHKGLIGPIIAG
jgi:hypothetical protein